MEEPAAVSSSYTLPRAFDQQRRKVGFLACCCNVKKGNRRPRPEEKRCRRNKGGERALFHAPCPWEREKETKSSKGEWEAREPYWRRKGGGKISRRRQGRSRRPGAKVALSGREGIRQTRVVSSYRREKKGSLPQAVAKRRKGRVGGGGGGTRQAHLSPVQRGPLNLVSEGTEETRHGCDAAFAILCKKKRRSGRYAARPDSMPCKRRKETSLGNFRGKRGG